MTPSSAWVADYADDSCMLRRAFEAGDQLAILELRQYVPSDKFEVVLVSSTLAPTRRPLRVRFEPDTGWFEPNDLFFVDSDDRHGVLFTDSLRAAEFKPKGQDWPPWLEPDREAREQVVTSLAVAGSFERDLSLQLGKMRQPMQALRTCMDDLVTRWGLDPAVQRTLSRSIAPRNPRAWMAQASSYPREMVRKELEGRVSLRLIVGPDGKPRKCLPQQGYSNPAFNEAACDGMMRYGRFDPALDANGTPVASYYATTLVYALN